MTNLSVPKASNRVPASEAPIKLGRKVKTVDVALLPADGSKPKVIPITFHTLPDKVEPRLREYGQNLVPNFHRSWRVYQFDRRFRQHNFADQASEESNGNYRLYWNENDELSENETVKNLLDLEKVDAMRRFWYGDVFLVRYSEHPETFAFDVYDAPASILQSQDLKAEFRSMWEDEYLEGELDADRYFGERREKSEADKEILWQRMTPAEREISSRLPPGMLDFLAITDCDDGAIRDVSVKKDPNDPTMMQISYMRKLSALEAVNWTGFGSAQL